ncbi:hypothetical protein PoB_004339800 [Plakobranchus ocellatus]|uniref:Uncharacterized protein n=1 Tax=Plakobranchus ocellatus TaxID=259542 RepID=A0AAV4BCI2_9GAST|nr:hypothetical protein PoB_004339800 [Plakobranchus ocellatus]
MLWSRLSPVQASSEELREHVLQGKPARVVLDRGSYRETFLLDNVNMNGNVICGEATDRMSSSLGSDAEFQPILVCTNGHVDYLNYSATSRDGNFVNNVWIVDAISFRTRDYSPDNTPVSSRYLDGSSRMQFMDNYLIMARKSEMRGVMRDRAYAFHIDNTHTDLDSGHTSGQSLNHISQSYTPTGDIIFRSQPYHWFSSWETTGI